MRPAVISLCDKTGNMVRPWAEAGFECWCVDVQHSIRRDRTEPVGAGLIHYVWGDARSWCPPSGVIKRLRVMFGFPPCTELTCTGARDFQKKRGWMLADAVQLFDSCIMACEFSGAPFMVENPARSRLNTHRRAPDYKFHPWEYAGYLPDIETDNTTKETGLWIGNGFLIPPRKPAPFPHRHDCFEAPPSDDRADTRSITPMGFAMAVFQANSTAIAISQ
jgi:hypothetical protein